MPSWVFAEISSVQLETKVLHFARSSRGILKPQSPGIPDVAMTLQSRPAVSPCQISATSWQQRAAVVRGSARFP